MHQQIAKRAEASWQQHGAASQRIAGSLAARRRKLCLSALLLRPAKARCMLHVAVVAPYFNCRTLPNLVQSQLKDGWGCFHLAAAAAVAISGGGVVSLCNATGHVATLQQGIKREQIERRIAPAAAAAAIKPARRSYVAMGQQQQQQQKQSLAATIDSSSSNCWQQQQQQSSAATATILRFKSYDKRGDTQVGGVQGAEKGGGMVWQGKGVRDAWLRLRF